jgi:hypothetical protein
MPVYVEATSRHGLLVSVPLFTPSLLWARPGGAVVSLERPAASFIGRGHGDSGSMSAALPDGATAFVEWNRVGGRTLVSALEMGSDAQVRWRRGLVVDRAFPIALGRWGGASGIVLWTPDGVAPGEWDGLTAAPRFLSPTRFQIEWTHEAMCVRAVTLNRGDPSREMAEVTMTLDACPGDRFEGSLDDEGLHRVSCAVDPADR